MSILTRSIPVLAVTATLGLSAAPALATSSHHGRDAGGPGSDTTSHGQRYGKLRTCGLDRAWLKDVARSDRAEIATGTLAQQKATSQGVKDLGAMLVADHTKHLGLVQALSDRLGLPVPAAPSPTQQWEAAVLGTFSGAAFDQQWTALQIAAHQENIERTQDEIAGGCNRMVRALAAMTLPTLQAHLAAAQQLAGGGTTGTTTGTGDTSGSGSGAVAGAGDTSGTGSGSSSQRDCDNGGRHHHGDDCCADDEGGSGGSGGSSRS
jgi:putative membrane protein